MNTGLHTIRAQYLGDLDYDPANTSTVIIRVVPAKLTLTAVDQTRTYGDLNPALHLQHHGLCQRRLPRPIQAVRHTGAHDRRGRPLPARPVSTPSPSHRARSTITDNNYTFDPTQIHGGKLTIQPAPLTIAAANLLRVYGRIPPTGTLGLRERRDFCHQRSDRRATLSTPATPFSSVGSLSDFCHQRLAVVLELRFYLLFRNSDHHPAVLMVNPADATRVYGASAPVMPTP